MASGIYSNNDMAYVGEKPWHGLGNKLEAGASIEQWVVSAGMDWNIREAAVRYEPGLQMSMIVPDKKVLYRDDHGGPLGVVGDSFQVVQPRQVLEFFRDLTENAGFKLETAGCLFGGKRFWALANTGEGREIVPGDVLREYLLLCTGADGSLATTGKYVAERVVCNNTLGIALKEGGLQHKISHRSVFDPRTMKQALKIDESKLGFDLLANKAQQLSDQYCSRMLAQSLALALLAPKDINKQEQADKIATLTKVEESKGFAKIMSLFEGEGKGSKLDGVKDTKWGFLNAVTEYADHHTRAKSDDHRLNRVVEGDADELKAKALELLSR